MTGKVVWHMTMSLDGFIAGPDDDLDWYSADTGPSELADEVIRTTGAFMAGGRLLTEDYDFETMQPYGGAWTGPIFILTHKDPATSPHPSMTFVSGDIRDAVATALAAADGKNLVVTGGTVPRLCTDAGLVDEIVLHILPILLGEGIPFYASPGAKRTGLELLRSEGMNFHLRVVK